jgi:hypothetical protein
MAGDKQLLHLVFGGELDKLSDVRFKDLSQLHVVGMYPNYKAAYEAWQSAARSTVDNAHMRYFIVHVHRLLDPNTDSSRRADTENAEAPSRPIREHYPRDE